MLGVDDVVPMCGTASVAVPAPGLTVNSVAVANVVVMFGTGDVVEVSAALGAGDIVDGTDVSVTGTVVPVGGMLAVCVGTAWLVAWVSKATSSVGCAIVVGSRFDGRHAPIISRITTAKTNLFILPSLGLPRTVQKRVTRSVRSYPAHFINDESMCAGL
jgi:hypothetical protein